MGKYKISLVVLALAGLVSCTSLSEGSTSNEIVTEPETRVMVDSDGTETLRDRMDEQSSEINRKRNIEEFDKNKPAMTPPDLRPQQVPHAPIDSAIHNSSNWLGRSLFKNRLILN